MLEVGTLTIGTVFDCDDAGLQGERLGGVEGKFGFGEGG